MKTNETSKKTLSFFQTIGLTLAFLTAFGNRTALAQTNYIDENGATLQATTVTTLDGTETSLSNGWYLASGTLVYNTTLKVSGDVHLILEDGCSTGSGGAITVCGGNVSATLNATASGTDASFGLYSSAAYTQTGGTVTASASDTYSSAF